MTKRNRKISLLSPEATGGDIAEAGFQYQASLIASRVPYWLKQDGFTETIQEALGDVEASFFTPERGICREFIEYKNHRLTPSEFWPEIERFWEMDKTSPEAYFKFVLACKDVSDDIKSMLNALRRVRDAYPFYQNASEIQNSSFLDFEVIVNNLYQKEAISRFLFDKVFFEIDLTDAESYAREKFREALYNCFPELQNFTAKVGSEAFNNVSDLIRNRRNKPIRRNELELAITNAVEPTYKLAKNIRLHTLHEENNQSPSNTICFKWASFFGGKERNFPFSDDWNNILLKQLEETRKWIISADRPRRISLTGNRRLSASLAIGSVFSSVAGFIIEVETKDGLWKTNNYPSSDTPNYSWAETFIEGQPNNEMILALSVIRDIRQEVCSYIETVGLNAPVLYIFGESPLISDKQTNLAVERVKKSLLNKIAIYHIDKIHLFFAGPAQLGLFLGHRLNSTCHIQCYEHNIQHAYVKTCLLKF